MRIINSHIGIMLILVILISGCTGTTNSISIKELSTNPQKYVGKNVTLTGTMAFFSAAYYIMDGEGYYFYVVINNERIFDSEKTYTITGTINFVSDDPINVQTHRDYSITIS